MEPKNIFNILTASDKLAVVDYTTNKSITYNDLINRSTELSKDMTSGQIVKFDADDSIEFIVWFFAALKAKAVFCFAEIEPSKDNDLAFLMSTSGTTGNPKPIYHTHTKICKILETTCVKIPRDIDRVLIVASPSHMNGLLNLLVSLYCNHTAYITKRFDVDAVRECIQKNNITKIVTVPTVFEYILTKEFFNTSVTNIRVASSLCKVELLQRIRKAFINSKIFNSYGIMEIGPGLFGFHPRGLSIPDGSVGYPLPNYEYKIVDGILQLKTPFDKEFRITNDLFTVDKDGFYYCHGRVDDVFKCGGYTINPIEIENEIEKIQGVIKAIVIPMADDIKENKPICILIGKVETNDINRQLKLEDYKKPRKYIEVDQLPLNAAGKVDRKKLRQDYE
jgi:long-chain acyl-CoA synthetase